MDIYCLFGDPIDNSKSPEIHNKFFESQKVNATYILHPTRDPKSIIDPNFNYKGASVTIPLKETIIPYLDKISEHASKMGAVNTITRLDNGKLYGDNTDWLAIRDVIRENYISKLDVDDISTKEALVIGSGGTSLAACYALKLLKIPFSICCRNKEKGQELIDKFSGLDITDKEFKKDFKLVIICVPPEVELDFSNLNGALIIEMAYTKEPNRNYGNNQVYYGTDILFRQAVYQNTMWIKYDN